MSLKDEFKKLITELATKFTLPAFHIGGQPKDAQFMAISLEGVAVGVSVDGDRDLLALWRKGVQIRWS